MSRIFASILDRTGLEKQEELTVVCTAGRLKLVVSGMSGTVERALPGGSGGGLGPAEPLGDGPVPALAVQQPLVQQIVDELTGKAGAAGCASKAPNAVRCAEVVDAVLSGYYGGRARSFWADEPSSWPGHAAAAARAEASL
eukprot:SAG22_NODE_535_length_9385_cov_6.941202_2_plen_141_part_00